MENSCSTTIITTITRHATRITPPVRAHIREKTIIVILWVLAETKRGKNIKIHYLDTLPFAMNVGTVTTIMATKQKAMRALSTTTGAINTINTTKLNTTMTAETPTTKMTNTYSTITINTTIKAATELQNKQ